MAFARSLRIGCVALLLVSCTPVAVLPSDEVLEKAIVAGSELRSADLAVVVSVEREDGGQPTQLKLNLDGTVQDGGRQLFLSMDGALRVGKEDAPLQQITWGGDFLLAAEGQSYLRLRSLASQPTLPMLGDEASRSLLNQWWLLPVTGSGAGSLTPDPHMIELQARALVVTEDKGMGIVNGKRAYRYAVTVDRQRIREFLTDVARQRGEQPDAELLGALDALEFSGNAMIDAKTFHLLHVDWSIRSTDTTDPLRLEIAADLLNHDASSPIALPKDAKPFPRDVEMLLPPDVQQELIRALQNPR